MECPACAEKAGGFCRENKPKPVCSAGINYNPKGKKAQGKFIREICTYQTLTIYRFCEFMPAGQRILQLIAAEVLGPLDYKEMKQCQEN
jgi:hypothetical protein